MPNYNLERNSVQHQFFMSRAKIQFFGGGFGNGKTTAMVIKFIQLAEDYPGCNLLLGRSTYPKLNDTLRKEFFKWCPQYNIKRMPTKEDNTCHFHNGSVINFRYISQRGKTNADGETTSNLLSANFDAVGVDQCEDPEIQHKDILDLMGRLRGQTGYQGEDPTMPSTGPRWLVLSANPNMGWVYKKLIKPYEQWRDRGIISPDLVIDKGSNEPLMQLFEGSTYTNAANLPPDFLQGLEASYKGQQYERFVMGRWAAFEGLIYENFNTEIQSLTREQIVTHLVDCVGRHVRVRVIEAYDFGLTSPSCYGLFFIDDWGRVFLLDGFYKPDFPYDKHVEEIRNIRRRYNNLLHYHDAIRADPAIFKKVIIGGKRDTGDTLAKLLGAASDQVRFRPATNDMLAGIAKVASYINAHEHIEHPITGLPNAPLLYVSRELEWFEDEVQNYFWKKNPMGDKLDEPMEAKDHAMDMTKYALSHLPDPSEIVVPSEAEPPLWTKWHEVEDNYA